jgi:type IV pilus assembly protein PilV
MPVSAVRRNVPRGRQSGATMIEVLVALFVLSVGLLGVAGMQQIGLRNGHTAQMRGQATALATDIADRMRANRRAALAGDYNIDIDTDITDTSGCPATTSADQVTCDLAEWKQALSDRLPLGAGSVETLANANGGERVRISIRWREGRGDALDVADPDDFVVFQTETQL